MNVVTLDFETYFDNDYTLKKMTTEAYVRDPRFEALGCGIRWPDGHKDWLDSEECKRLLPAFAAQGFAVLCHHAQFDGLILSHHFGVKPALWLDTLSMARQVLGTHVSASLASVAEYYGLAPKNVPYDLFRGKHWHELTPDEQRQVADGCLHDVELTWQIFNRLAKTFPAEEYGVVDMTIRMFTEATLVGDIPLLGKVWTSEQHRKRDLLAEIGVTEKDLQSADTFAELLRAQGVEPEQKEGKPQKCNTCLGTGHIEGADKGGVWRCDVCDGTGKIPKNIYAFAKIDEFMKGLLEDEDPVVAALAAARLGVRSTIDQTRAERLGWMATRGPMPVYLRYGGAHTLRWSGGDAVNWQNFRRGSDMRRAIRAPAGYKLGVVDASQIECRILNTLAGQWDVVERFRRGEDPYIGIASAAYGRDISKADVAERGTGKQLELSCGFGAGAETILNTAKKGTYGPPVLIDLPTAYRWRDIYRNSHLQVVDLWGFAGRLISRLASPGHEPLQWGPCVVRDQRIYGPNGSWLNYSSLEYSEEWQGWRVKTSRRGWSKLYGGKLVENVVQFLARIVLSQAMLRVRARGLRVLNCTHDEMIVLLKQDGTEREVYNSLLDEMSRTPEWMPELPLAAEGALEEFYAK